MTRLLVVDDEVAIVEALQDILSEKGYEVAVAYNGQEGLRRLGEFRPDLMLLDLMMPVMDGRELLQRIRADPSLCELPVVVMSAGRIAEQERQAASATLPKPFELETLLKTIARHIGRSAPPGSEEPRP